MNMSPEEKRARERHPAYKSARQTLWDMGKCGSMSQNGHLCTLTENHRPRPHEAQILGGVDDGRLLEEWPW